MPLVVTPEVLRTTQQSIESALEHATMLTNQYLSDHEGVAAAIWGGNAKNASISTAGQISHDLNQTITGGTRLANGLGRAAELIEQHEADAAHSLSFTNPA